jgi:hypothetical protein
MSGLVGVHTLSSLCSDCTFTFPFSPLSIQMIFEAVVSHSQPIPIGYGLAALSAFGLKSLFFLYSTGKCGIDQ